MQKQRREKNERRVVQKSDRQIEIAITADRRVEMKDKRGQTEGREVQHKRRASSLFEQHEETDKQVDQTNQIDVDNSRRPLMNRAEVIEVGPVGATLGRVRRPLHQVVDLSTDARLFEIDLHVARAT